MDFSLLPPFSGDGNTDAKLWLTRFQLLTTTKGLNDNKAKATLPLLLTDNALRWYMSLTQNIRDDFSLLQKEFLIRYGPDERVQWQRTAALYQTVQGASEKVEDFIANIVAKGTELELPQTQIKHIIINGLKPHIRQFVLQQNPETVDDLRQSARLAEVTTTDSTKEQQTLVAAIQRLEEKLEAMSVAVSSRPEFKHSLRDGGQWNKRTRQQTEVCGWCGRFSGHAKQNCPAYGKQCHKCRRFNHFAVACRSASRTQSTM
ncbi:hypothetical protein ACJMK2_032115 [Sinanodonta woodiana]|uniref:Retrotransposon gag domain-containing protein n=1 Tax=Sinanodonta woodiana TaxID=1069815 RepID=A0ABD3X2K1_SINWO